MLNEIPIRIVSRRFPEVIIPYKEGGATLGARGARSRRFLGWGRGRGHFDWGIALDRLKHFDVGGGRTFRHLGDLTHG